MVLWALLDNGLEDGSCIATLALQRHPGIPLAVRVDLCRGDRIVADRTQKVIDRTELLGGRGGEQRQPVWLELGADAWDLAHEMSFGDLEDCLLSRSHLDVATLAGDCGPVAKITLDLD